MLYNFYSPGFTTLQGYNRPCSLSWCAACVTNSQSVGMGRGAELRAQEEGGRWLVGAQQWEKMPLATVPQGNEESRGGRHREGEQTKEWRKRERRGMLFPMETAPKVSLSLKSNTHIKHHTHILQTHKCHISRCLIIYLSIHKCSLHISWF